MQEAVPEGKGAMAVVMGLSAEDVGAVCDSIPGVYPANYNSPMQTVVAGERSAVEEASERLLAAGAKRVMALDVSAPFHCPLMKPAAERLAPALRDVPFNDLRVPVLSNVTAHPYRTAAEARTLLREQVCAPVRWSDSVKTLVEEGVKVQLEVGPGNVLTGLAGRIERRLARAHVSHLDDVDPALERVSEGLA
jgi:[acyl-carrier-protein] S-malonyltransferase